MARARAEFARTSQAALSRRLAEVNRAGLALLESKAKSSAAPVEAEKAVTRINDILDERAALEKEIDSLNKECERLRPWGSFDPKQIEALAKKGITVALCTASPKNMPEIPEGVTAEEISRDSAQVCLALISRAPFDTKGLNVVTLPERSLAELETAMNAARAKREELQAELETFTPSLDAIPMWKRFPAHILLEQQFYTRKELPAGQASEPDFFLLQDNAAFHNSWYAALHCC